MKSRILSVHGVTPEHLHLACFAQLPHRARRRTNGALPHEIQVQIEFQLEQSSTGWQSLEFLAWFVRDTARGQLPIQLCPFAPPPTAASNVQLGHTLRFHIDYFSPGSAGDTHPILRAIGLLAEALNKTIHLYDLSLRKRGRPRLTHPEP